MGIPVLILGYSGSGKTRSIKHMDSETTGVFLVEKPRLPFREKFRKKMRMTISRSAEILSPMIMVINKENDEQP